MLKCIIVDDELFAREILKGLLQKYFHNNVKVVAEAECIDSAVNQIRIYSPDLIFLDIEMGEEVGFDLYAHFPTHDFKVVFTTGHENYAIQAIRVEAYDYLVKPISEIELKNCIERLQNDSSLEITSNKYISLPSKDGSVNVNTYDIAYLVAKVNYTNIVLSDGNTYFVAKTLKKFEDSLPSSTFFRIHKSIIVNKEHIKGVIKNDEIEMIDGEKFEVAGRRKKDFYNFLSK